MSDNEWPGPRGRERSMSLAQFEVFQQAQAKMKAEREAEEARVKGLEAELASLRTALASAERENERLRKDWLAMDDDRKIAESRAKEAEGERDQALPWKLFYGDGKTLGEVAAHFGVSIYKFSPWLTAPIINACIAERERAAKAEAERDSALARATEAEKALLALLMAYESGADDLYNECVAARSVLRIAKEEKL